jgi:hypothetical protein
MGSFGARKASGRREGAELAPNVGSGRLLHQLGDSQRGQSGDLLRHVQRSPLLARDADRLWRERRIGRIRVIKSVGGQ